MDWRQAIISKFIRRGREIQMIDLSQEYKNCEEKNKEFKL